VSTQGLYNVGLLWDCGYRNFSTPDPSRGYNFIPVPDPYVPVDGHGLGQSMGWIGLGRFLEFFVSWVGWQWCAFTSAGVSTGDRPKPPSFAVGSKEFVMGG